MSFAFFVFTAALWILVAARAAQGDALAQAPAPKSSLKAGRGRRLPM